MYRPLRSRRLRLFATQLMLLCVFLSVLLQFTHVMKLNPEHYDEKPQHIQLHLSATAHQHAGGQETIDEAELTRIKVHVFMHANLGYYMASDSLWLPIRGPESSPPTSFSTRAYSLIHRPPVPPPLV